MTATNDKTELTAEVFEASLREHAITMGAEQKAQVLETARWLHDGVEALKHAFPDLAKTIR
jgi:hypothetical protein